MLLLIHGEDMQERDLATTPMLRESCTRVSVLLVITPLLILRQLETLGNDYRMTVDLQRQLA